MCSVADRGRGFDGALVPGRGLAESVVGRGRDVGFTTSIATRAGGGTTVTLTCALDAPPSEGVDPSTVTGSDASLPALGRAATRIWTGLVIGVGLVITAVTPAPQRWPMAAMIGVLVVLGGAEYLATRRTGRTPWWLICTHVGAIPALFAFGALVPDAATTPVSYWQALSVTPLLSTTLARRGPWRRAPGILVASAVFLASCAVVVGGTVAGERAAAPTVVPAWALAQLGLFAGMAELHRLFGTMTAQLRREQREILRLRLATAAVRARTTARRRWTAAELHASLEVLKRIGAGIDDPGDPAVRERCGREEHHLRQVISLSAMQPHLNPWLARAMADARSRSVILTVRIDDTATVSEAEAATGGAAVLRIVGNAPRGTRLQVTVLHTASGLRTLLVSEQWSLAPWAALPLPPGWTVSHRSLGAQEVLELHLPASTTAAALPRAPVDPLAPPARLARSSRRIDLLRARELILTRPGRARTR